MSKYSTPSNYIKKHTTRTNESSKANSFHSIKKLSPGLPKIKWKKKVRPGQIHYPTVKSAVHTVKADENDEVCLSLSWNITFSWRARAASTGPDNGGARKKRPRAKNRELELKIPLWNRRCRQGSLSPLLSNSFPFRAANITNSPGARAQSPSGRAKNRQIARSNCAKQTRRPRRPAKPSGYFASRPASLLLARTDAPALSDLFKRQNKCFPPTFIA